MRPQTFSRALFLFVSLSGSLVIPVWTAQTQQDGTQKKTEAQAKDEPKEPEAVDIEDATKQEQKPLPEVGYTKEEYEEFNKALTNPDLKSRAEGLDSFIKTHPNSKLNEYAIAQFAPLQRQLYDQKDMVNLAAVSEIYLQLKPEDIATLGYATEANYTNKNYAKAVQYGEAFYKSKPSKELAQLLAFSFEQLKNDPKFVVYAEKCIAEMPPKDAFFYAAKLSFIFANQRNIPKAAAYSQKMISAYGEGEIPPGYTAATWNQEKARSYAIIGRNFYDRKQYAAAVGALSSSLKYFPQNDEAYYYLGMSYWFASDTFNAQKALAKAALLNKPYSKTARSQLENLYKQLHNGSMEGFDAVLRAAGAEMK